MIQRSGRTTVPQIWIGDRHVGGFDDLAALERRGELDALLGRKKDEAGDAEHVKLLIIGSGPAGYTAAIYAARAELAPVVLAGLQFGGQLMLTTDVENYPGFPASVAGPEMMERFQNQAERFGTRVLLEDATRVDLSKRPFRVETEDEAFLADAVIIATGATREVDRPARPSSASRTSGVSACATCDGALYRGKAMAVVGGGDTAMEEALFLTRYATKVTVIHRRDELRASKIMQERALKNEKIEFLWNSAVEEVLGDDFVTGLRVKNLKTGAVAQLPVEALFVAIGHKPNTDLFRGQLELDDVGYLKVEPGTTRTSVEGVFACGDVMDPDLPPGGHRRRHRLHGRDRRERWLAEHDG